MIETTMSIENSPTETLQSLLRRGLETGLVDAWLVPMRTLRREAAGSVAPMLVKDPAALKHADPLAPVLPINAARAASQLTLTGHREKLGLVLRARAIDNGSWMACAHWVTSDCGLRSVIVDPYGMVVAASQFQKAGVIHVDVDFEDEKVYYTGRKAEQPKRGTKGIPSYFTEDIPEQRKGWRDMIFARRRPELYGIIPTVNEAIMRYRPEKGR